MVNRIKNEDLIMFFKYQRYSKKKKKTVLYGNRQQLSLSIHRVLVLGPLGYQQPWKLKSLMDNGIDRAECTDIIKCRWT